MELVLATVVILGICIFWVYQFVQLMLLSEANFPSKYDKCLWTAVFIVAFPLAPFAFFGWKFAYRAMLASQSRPKNQEP
jgi:hypothetical protein